MFRHVSPSVKRGVYPRLLCLCESTAARVIQIRESLEHRCMRSLQQSVLQRKRERGERERGEREREREERVSERGVWGSERGGGGYC